MTLFVVIAPIVVCSAVVYAYVAAAVVRIFVCGAYGKIVAHGVTETYSETPWRVELEVVAFAVLAVVMCSVVLVEVVVKAGVVGCSEIIPCRGVGVQTYTERRLLDGTDDDT